MMVASLLPAAMAAFDKCARPNGEWAGFDQVIILHRCANAFYMTPTGPVTVGYSQSPSVSVGADTKTWDTPGSGGATGSHMIWDLTDPLGCMRVTRTYFISDGTGQDAEL